MDNLYFIAVLTPDDITSLVRRYQQDFADEYESSRQLKIPVHVTLIPPFRMSAKEENEVQTILNTVSSSHNSFNIRLKDFGHFDDRVIFIKVDEPIALSGLHDQLRERLSGQYKLKPSFGFHPHVTLANRDLTTANFKKGWEKYKHLTFQSEFSCEELALLKHNGKVWEVIYFSEFNA